MLGRRCVVTFRAEGHKCLPDLVLKKGSKTKMPSVADPLGDRRLAGWSCRGVVAVPGETVTIAGDTDFVALWSTTKFTVSIDTCGSGALPDMTVRAGDEVEMPDSEMPGYRLAGWSDGTSVYAVGDRVKVLSDMRLKAVWERAAEGKRASGARGRAVRRVSFDAGPGAKPPKPLKAKDGDSVTLPERVEGAQGELLGWTDGRNRYEPGRRVVVSGDVAFKAVWGKGSSVRSIRKVEVSFDARGGSVTGSWRISPGESLVMPSSFMKGYELEGWRLGDETYCVGESVEFAEDATLVAVWAESGGRAGRGGRRLRPGRRRPGNRNLLLAVGDSADDRAVPAMLGHAFDRNGLVG